MKAIYRVVKLERAARSASTRDHGLKGAGWSSLLTYGLRKDGFVALSGDGALRTRALRWRGGELEVNHEGNVTVGVVGVPAMKQLT